MRNFAFLIAGDDHRALIGKRNGHLVIHAAHLMHGDTLHGIRPARAVT